eukprot:938862_1
MGNGNSSDSNTTAPKSNTTAPKSNTTAPKSNTTAPKSNTTAPKSNTIAINVEIIGHVKDKLVVHSVYGKEQKMKQILNKITNHLNTKYDPVKCEIDWIESASFTEEIWNITDLDNKSITEYDRNGIKTKGLRVYVRVKYNVSITCPDMKRLGTADPMKCAVY